MSPYSSHFLVFVILVVSQYACATDKSTYTSCSKDGAIATMSELTLPSPISLSDTINATVDLTFHKDVPEGAFIKVNFYKVQYIFGAAVSIPIPCILGYGSCTTEHCEYISGVKDAVCPFFPEGRNCDCPIQAGHYKGVNVPMGKPELGPLGKFLAKGHFKMQFRILSKDKKDELFCGIFTGKLAN